jgi:hypothetical protein
MAKWCFMEAYSYIFWVVEGMSELWPEKKVRIFKGSGLGLQLLRMVGLDGGRVTVQS